MYIYIYIYIYVIIIIIIVAAGNDGNASMPENVKPNPYLVVLDSVFPYYFEIVFLRCKFSLRGVFKHSVSVFCIQ